MSLELFLACVIVMALGLASYVWLAIATVRATSIPRDWKWAVLMPPAACWVAFRAGGWPRAAAVLFLLCACTYGALRVAL